MLSADGLPVEHTTTVPVENTSIASDAATDSPTVPVFETVEAFRRRVPVSVFYFHSSPFCCNTHEHLVSHLSFLPSSLLPLSLPYIVVHACVCVYMHVFDVYM